MRAQACDVGSFPRIINLHPSLLRKFPVAKAWKQALARGRNQSHRLHGPRMSMRALIAANHRAASNAPFCLTTPATLHERIQLAERELFPAVIGKLAAQLAESKN
jgi:folate-dependent phosphoribosylglycinamide formyltransferase PurN